MLVPDWVRGSSTPQNRGVTLAQVADNIDHHLPGGRQRAPRHGIGSDLDARGIGTPERGAGRRGHALRDLQKVPALLAQRAYSAQDIENVCHGNFLRSSGRLGVDRQR